MMPPLWCRRWVFSVRGRGSQLAPYQIRYSGLHTLLGKHRLERALERAARERLDAFAQSSGIPGRLEQVVRRGDVEGCTTSELDARVYELFEAVFHEPED